MIQCQRCVFSYKRGRGSWVAVGVPPDCPVDVDVLDKQRNQQIQKEQELEKQAAVQWQFGDPRVAHRLRSDEGRERGRRETHGITASERWTQSVCLKHHVCQTQTSPPGKFNHSLWQWR